MAKKNRTETNRMKNKPKADALEKQLMAIVDVVDVADSLTAPIVRSIESLLRQAALMMGSDEASVLVRDGNKGGLKFLLAIGEVADKLMKLKIPPGKGIAGFVFSSGQPMAVADVGQEETFYAEVDKKTGYSTQTILATPLRVDGEVIGVLEFVNRDGEPPYQPFTPDEMDKAAYYAEAIATLVDAHEAASLIETIFTRMIDTAKNKKTVDEKELRQWLKEVRTQPEHLDMIAMAVALREVASRGDAERKFCREAIEALARYTAKNTGGGFSFLKY